MSGNLKTAETHEKFLQYLRDSHRRACIIGSWLRARHPGWKISIPKPKEAPTHEDQPEYSDSGDMFVQRQDGGLIYHLEAKGLLKPRSNWTCREDWPYPVVIFDAEQKWQRKDPKPYAYLILSERCDSLAIVREATRTYWRTQEVKDGNFEGHSQICLVVDPPHVEFRRLQDQDESILEWMMEYDEGTDGIIGTSRPNDREGSDGKTDQAD